MFLEDYALAGSQIMLRNYKKLCSSRLNKRLYAATLRLAHEVLKNATRAWYYSLQKIGPLKIAMQRQLCVIAVSACLVLHEPAIALKLWAKGMSLNLFNIEEAINPAAMSEIYDMVRKIRHRYEECNFQLDTTKFWLLMEDARRPEEARTGYDDIYAEYYDPDELDEENAGELDPYDSDKPDPDEDEDEANQTDEDEADQIAPVVPV